MIIYIWLNSLQELLTTNSYNNDHHLIVLVAVPTTDKSKRKRLHGLQLILKQVLDHNVTLLIKS